MLGVLVTSSQMLIWFFYLLIALYGGAEDFSGGRDHPALLTFMFILGIVGYEIIPGFILYRELSTSIGDTSTSDSHELLMEANNETKPFLDKFDFESLEAGTLHGSSSPNRLSNRRPPRPSESSLEQILAMGARGKPLHPDDDDGSIASTRSFIRSLGGGSVDSNTEVELFRARAASAFVSSDSSTTSSTPGTVRMPLYADKHNRPRASTDHGTHGEHQLLPVSEEEGEEKESSVNIELSPPPRYPSPVNISRSTLSPTRIRQMHDNLDHNLMATVPEGVLTTYSSPVPRLTPTSSISSFLRKRAVAPLKPRVASADRSNAALSNITQVAAATAALDPNKVLPMLMKLGVSSVEAAGMMTYLMRMKELSEGKGKGKKSNSLAMVV